jgi:vacuolar-type H+-ATPase subunit H
LLAQIEASEAEARDIVDNAHSDARKHLLDAENRLLEEVAAIRREREQERESAFHETVDAAESELAGVREEALGKVSGVAEQVLELFMPGDSRGNS